MIFIEFVNEIYFYKECVFILIKVNIMDIFNNFNFIYKYNIFREIFEFFQIL